MPRSERIGQFIWNELVDENGVLASDIDHGLSTSIWNISNADFMKLLLEYFNDT